MDVHQVALTEFIIFVTVMCLFMLCVCCISCRCLRRSRQDRHPPAAQPFPLHPVPSSPVRAQDLETGLYHQSSRAPDVILVRQAYTPHQCRQYLSNGVNIYATHLQYKLAILYSLNNDLSLQRADSLAFCDQCVICLSEFEEEDECYVIGNCTHVFHRHCAESWLTKTHMVCPVCRSHVNVNVFVAFHPSLPAGNS